MIVIATFILACRHVTLILIENAIHFSLSLHPDEYDSRQNEVVKNEELTYNSHAATCTRTHAGVLIVLLGSMVMAIV